MVKLFAVFLLMNSLAMAGNPIQDELSLAVHMNNTPEIKRLLDRGANPNIFEFDPLLFYPASSCNAENFDLLLERGADPAQTDIGQQTVLHRLSIGTCYPLTMTFIDWLQKKRPEIIRARTKQGFTALHDAVLGYETGSNIVDIVNKLLSAGLNISDRTHDGRTSIFFVRHTNVAEFLLKNGANVNDFATVNGTRTSPLYESLLRAKKKELFPLMVKHSSKETINARVRGETVLIAAIRNITGYTRILLEAGADPLLADDSGKTPLDHAREIKFEVSREETVHVLNEFIKK